MTPPYRFIIASFVYSTAADTQHAKASAAKRLRSNRHRGDYSPQVGQHPATALAPPLGCKTPKPVATTGVGSSPAARGGGWNEKKSYAQIWESKTAEDKAGASRSGSQQECRVEHPSLARIETRIPARD